MDHSNVSKAFRRAIKDAGLPAHFSPHCLRHTYASQLLADGVSPAYVSEQLDHASIELTVGTYGRWLRKKAPGAVDGLDDVVPVAEEKVVSAAQNASSEPRSGPHGSNLVATGPRRRPRRLQVVEGTGDSGRTRTFNPEIKSRHKSRIRNPANKAKSLIRQARLEVSHTLCYTALSRPSRARLAHGGSHEHRDS